MRGHVKERILTAIAKWCIVRLKRKGKLPVGLPGHRDPDNRCEVYMPNRVKDAWSHFQDCRGDGHYLCSSCVHRAVPVCSDCGKPATCIGTFEGMTKETYSCDECCGHGQEDGRCRFIESSHDVIRV